MQQLATIFDTAASELGPRRLQQFTTPPATTGTDVATRQAPDDPDEDATATAFANQSSQPAPDQITGSPKRTRVVRPTPTDPNPASSTPTPDQLIPTQQRQTDAYPDDPATILRAPVAADEPAGAEHPSEHVGEAVTKKNKRRLILVIGAVIIVIVVVAGLLIARSSTAGSTDYKTAAEKAIMSDQGGLGAGSSAKCDTPSSTAVGTTFKCTGTAADGTVYDVIATIDKKDHVQVQSTG